MPVGKCSQDAPVMRKRCQQHMEMEDLMRRKEVIEDTGHETLRDSIRTVTKQVVSLRDEHMHRQSIHSLKQCACDIQ
jgi:hypothetical protein